MENQKIIEEYLNGVTINQLIKKYHHKYETIRKILVNGDVALRTRSEAGKGTKKKEIPVEIQNKIIDNYVNKHYGQIKAGKEFGVSGFLVKKILKENNIVIRDYSEAAKLSNKNRAKYNNNDDYFKTQSSSMAWLLGFLASDGSLCKTDNSIKIGLSRIDREILERIKKEVGIEANIKDYTTSDGFDCSCLAWTSQMHREDLKEYSIIPQKTFCLKPPFKLEKKYWIDYIRGYFDGDGSVNYIHSKNNNHSGALRWQVCSATKEILSFIVDFLYEEYNIPKVSIRMEQRKNSPLYIISYSTLSTRKIYNILYTKDALYLERKKKKYEEILLLKENFFQETAAPTAEE